MTRTSWEDSRALRYKLNCICNTVTYVASYLIIIMMQTQMVLAVFMEVRKDHAYYNYSVYVLSIVCQC